MKGSKMSGFELLSAVGSWVQHGAMINPLDNDEPGFSVRFNAYDPEEFYHFPSKKAFAAFKRAMELCFDPER